jgi:peptide/nickel transport system permease protein
VSGAGDRPTGAAAWWEAIRRDRKASVGAALVAFFVLVGLVGPWLVTSPDALVGIPLQPPSLAHWLGTTGQGQDVLAQTVVGTRVSLLIGFGVGAAVVVVGALMGVTAGYFGGRVDGLLSLVFNVFLVLPGLPLAIVIAAYLPAGPATIAFVLVLTGWAWNARVLRAQTLMLRQRDFVAAAVVSGESHLRIITREILPNMTSLLVAQLIGSAVYAIGAQVGLEFLGLGDVSAVTWGTNLYWATNDSALLTGAWWTFVPTGLCVALVGFALTMLNSGFDEITNPRLQLERAWRAWLLGAGQPVTRSTPVVVARE